MATNKNTAERDTERLPSDREEQAISNRPNDPISGEDDRPDDVDTASDTEEDDEFVDEDEEEDEDAEEDAGDESI